MKIIYKVDLRVFYYFQIDIKKLIIIKSISKNQSLLNIYKNIKSNLYWIFKLSLLFKDILSNIKNRLTIYLSTFY